MTLFSKANLCIYRNFANSLFWPKLVFCERKIFIKLMKIRLIHRRHYVVSLSKTVYPLLSTGSTQEDREMSKHD